ncbi:MAG: hypothetical protein KDK36_17420, partial [Leptospiraceae bacterium]|nr:hypothetical protein [Leptospiraceae bacterium]
KGVLKDGRKVVIKIQYPGIEEIIKSDLKNLKILFKILISSFLKINIDKIWEEVNSQLINELDYEKELNNQNRFYEYYKDSEIAIIPKAIKELSTKRVLTSEMLLGDDIYICKKQSLAKRSLWSKNLFTLFLEQTFKFNFLHSDPNVGNFAFLENGKIIIYDFGSVKELPKEFAESLKKIFFLIQKHEFSSLPQAIKDLGIYHSGGKVLEDEILTNYAKLVYPVFAEEEYSFEGERFVVKEMMELKMNYTWKLMDIQVPSDLIFINRTLIGLTGNLNILQAKVNIKELLKPYEN